MRGICNNANGAADVGNIANGRPVVVASPLVVCAKKAGIVVCTPNAVVVMRTILVTVPTKVVPT